MKRKFYPISVLVILLVQAVFVVLILKKRYQELKQTEKDSQPKGNLAEVVYVTGDARLRRAGQLNWFPAEKGDKLYHGDRVFAGSKSTLEIKYQTKDDLYVTVAARSVFEVSETIPVSTKLAKKFEVSESSGGSGSKGPQPTETEMEFFGISLGDVLGQKSEDDESSDVDLDNLHLTMPEESGIKLDWRVVERPFLFPKGNFTLYPSQYPHAVMLFLESGFPEVKLFGNLWDLNTNDAPIWSGSGFSTFEFAIPKAGAFAFQAYSEDGRYKTPLIRIHARAPKGQNLAKLLGFDTLPKGEVVLVP